MKKYRLCILVVFASLFSLNAFAQEDTEYENLKTYGKLDLGFSGLGLSVEMPVSERVLLEFAGGLGAGYRVDEDFKYRLYFNDPSVFLSVNGKYYYNMEKRKTKGRPISFNAGNFFGLKVKYTTPTIIDSKNWNTLLVGMHWGLQRKMGKHFLYQFNVGIGGAVDLGDDSSTRLTLFPDANFRVSYVLPFR